MNHTARLCPGLMQSTFQGVALSKGLRCQMVPGHSRVPNASPAAATITWLFYLNTWRLLNIARVYLHQTLGNMYSDVFCIRSSWPSSINSLSGWKRWLLLPNLSKAHGVANPSQSARDQRCCFGACYLFPCIQSRTAGQAPCHKLILSNFPRRL